MKKILTLLMFSFTLLFSAQEMHSQNNIVEQKANEKANEIQKILNFKEAKFDGVFKAQKTYETGLQTLNESTKIKNESKDINTIVSERKKLKTNLNAQLEKILNPDEFQKYLGNGAL